MELLSVEIPKINPKKKDEIDNDIYDDRIAPNNFQNQNFGVKINF